MQARKGTKIAAARRIALEVLRRVEAEGAFTQLSLNHSLRRHGKLSRQDRALATELVYGTLRYRRRLDFGLAAYSSRPLEKIEPLLLRVLRLSAYQLLLLDKIPPWAAVDQGTELAGSIRGRRAAGFVNGVLRALAANREQIEWPDIEANPVRALGIIHSFPDWMVQRWLVDHDRERAVAIMEACNRPAPLWIRANTLRITPDGLCGLLSASGYEATEDNLVPGAVKLSGAGDISSLAAHETGLFHVQDAAAQAVCHLLDPRPGQRILDACGAPGGKTATVAELLKDNGKILSVDINPARVSLAKKLLQRLGIGSVERLAHDLSEGLIQGMSDFDRVLLDAPCSSLGVMRRHPESKWKIFPADLPLISETQKRLLDNVSQAVKPGGYLVYSVCTFSREEGAELIDEWLKLHPEFSIMDPRQGKRAPWHKLLDNQGRLATWPDLHDMDAFFAVRLVRARGHAKS
jgi:16S rRNA (cytosine967-C5)-methyltransferase